MINKATILGRIGKDPEIRTTASGSKIANLTIATSEFWKDKSGNKQEKTEWHRVVIFNDKLISNVVEKYVKKGSLAYIEGSLQTTKYTDAQGVEKYTTQIVLKGFSDVLKLIPTGSKQTAEGNTLNDSEVEQDIPDDDSIPF
jgi:single-strand DNA-binding protein